MSGEASYPSGLPAGPAAAYELPAITPTEPAVESGTPELRPIIAPGGLVANLAQPAQPPSKNLVTADQPGPAAEPSPGPSSGMFLEALDPPSPIRSPAGGPDWADRPDGGWAEAALPERLGMRTLTKPEGGRGRSGSGGSAEYSEPTSESWSEMLNAAEPGKPAARIAGPVEPVPVARPPSYEDLLNQAWANSGRLKDDEPPERQSQAVAQPASVEYSGSQISRWNPGTISPGANTTMGPAKPRGKCRMCVSHDKCQVM